MKAIEIACRKCDQQPGEWCRVMDSATGELGPAFEGWIHIARTEDAGYLTENASPVDINELDAAVENSGRV